MKNLLRPFSILVLKTQKQGIIELKYDCLIDLIVLDDRFLAGQNALLPIYQKAMSEGLSV